MTEQQQAAVAVRQIEPSDGADEVWASDAEGGPGDPGWSYERYGEAWCVMRLHNRMRLPSPGNPFASLDDAIVHTLGPAGVKRGRDGSPINAGDLPDGTLVDFQGMTFAAYPGTPRRWLSGVLPPVTDDQMTAALNAGRAAVSGQDTAAIALYEDILRDCRDH